MGACRVLQSIRPGTAAINSLLMADIQDTSVELLMAPLSMSHTQEADQGDVRADTLLLAVLRGRHILPYSRRTCLIARWLSPCTV